MYDILLSPIKLSELEILIQNSVRKILGENPKQHLQKESEKFLSIDEASQFLNLAKATIYGLVSAGKIPYMKQGKKLYFSKEKLSQWIQEGRNKSQEEITAEVDAAIVNSKKKRG